ncbi:MAG: YeeE/YedE thiosulfate transporter family protein [Rhodothermus sp.]|nr:YeeE/YedE thiosulfate transporter family protein [Rhodothermus sp.]
MAEVIRETRPEACIDIEQVAPDYEAQALEAGNRPGSLLAYLLLGIFFGIVLIKSEVASWFRIQEMFRFQSFHMYGVIGSAVVVAGLSIQLIKRFRLKTIHGEPIEIQPKIWGKGTRYWLGGILFGLGWGLLGACPGPMFALLGSGVTVMVVALFSAMLGTWAYAALRPRLPH